MSLRHDLLNDPALDAALDVALAHALKAPPSPSALQASVWQRIAMEQAQELASRKAAAEAEWQMASQQLDEQKVQMTRDTLAMVLGLAFTAGTVVATLGPAVMANGQWIDAHSQSFVLPGLAVLVGMAAGALVWVERLGWPRWLRLG